MTERWPIRPLRQVTTKIGSGATPRGGSEAYHAQGTPLIRSMNVHFDGVRSDGLVYLDDAQARALDGVTVHEGDVLWNITGASIGRVAVAPAFLAGARVNQHVSIIRPTSELDARFLAAFLASPSQQALVFAEESGATRQALTKGKIEEWEVPAPPIDEQRRIVAKLDALRGRSRRAKDALDAVPALLDRLRQSILAAAFRGDLTADWRAQNPDVEPASELLKRIRIERRKKWEEAELAKLVAKGKPPKDDRWKAKYVEPEPVDESELPELPDGWCWVSVESLSHDVTVGHVGSMQSEYVESGVPFLRSLNVRANRIDLRELRFIPPSFHERLRKSALRPGDVVIVRTGDPGVASVVPPTLPDANCSDLVILRLEQSVQPEYLSLYLNGPFARAHVLGAQVGVAQQHFNVAAARRMPVALAPLSEQRVIAARTTALQEWTRRLGESAGDAEADLRSLDSAILAAAFRGELVSRDDSSPDVLYPVHEAVGRS